ncbi:MAG: class I tRNA ligase family protein, partial [Acidobacteria bacterium]|nr:class I tRNA ligase family protein [Acidobacteriota bacterium]
PAPPAPAPADRQARRKLHQTIRKITEDFESRWHFNTSISALMELVNELYTAEGRLSREARDEALEALALLLGPFAPYLAQEIWRELGREGPVFRQAWPAYDPELASEEQAEIVLQVNGKVRSHLMAPFGTSREVLERRALADGRVQSLVDGRQVVKVIVVPDKLVNIVVK